MALDLTIAIPAHNDTDLLLALLTRLAALELAQAVIVVDDGSDCALDPDQLRAVSGLSDSQLTLLHHDQPKGAGAARNLALQQVKTRHLLYLDADDLPTRELRSLCLALQGQEDFDFCLFQHHDSRMNRDAIWGQMPHDQALWRAAGLEQGSLRPVAQHAAQHLVQTANYPWNKIYRSAFLQEQGIRCSETRVHNDIALHWQSFLRAKTILCSDHIGVVHFVTPGAARLTNRIDKERLRVFEPLQEIAEEIAAQAPAFAPAFAAFSLGLLLWVHGTLDGALQPDFITRARAFLAQHLPPAQRSALQARHPTSWQRATALFQLAE